MLTLEPHLAEFVGLANLEADADKSVVGGVKFDGNRAAFDYAVAKLRNMINVI